MKKISVIVPIYNSEKYLSRCIESIIVQSYKNVEIILVDDGSTDNSGSICDYYAEKDKRIKVIHKKNGGQSSARNKALDIAIGEYIAFVDSDDWISSDIYEYCIDLLETTNSNVVDFKCVFTSEGMGTIKLNSEYNVEILENKDILRDYLYRGQTEKAPFSPCRKVYERGLFEEVRFPEGKINEDIATNYRLLIKCRREVITSKIGYFYFQDGNSTTRDGLKKRDFNLLDACDELECLTKNEEYKDIQYLVKVKYARSYFSLLAKIAFYGICDKNIDSKNVIKEFTSKLRKNYFLLMSSPMPLNRKIMVTALTINIKCLSIPLNIYKLTLRRRKD